MSDQQQSLADPPTDPQQPFQTTLQQSLQQSDKIQKLKALIEKSSQQNSSIPPLSPANLEAQSNEPLRKALLSNKFASLLTSSGDLIKGEKHFLSGIQSLEQLSKPIAFSNIYLNLANLYAQKRDYALAIEYYLKTIDISPHKYKIQTQQKKTTIQEKEINQPIRHFEAFEYDEALNNPDAYLDAFTNIAVMYVNSGQKDKAFEFCIKAIELNPDNHEAMINLGDILRQLGRKNEAIDATWSCIERLTRQNKERENYVRPKPFNVKDITMSNDIISTNIQGQKNNIVNVLCVKWGSRYDAEYVNKLFRGISRHTTKKFVFYCFTEDPIGLHENIQHISLMAGWEKWWGKATLFNPMYNTQLIGDLNFYIDLDMVITGNLDQLFEYQGAFSILTTADLACEKDHKDGYNSSIMIWDKRLIGLTSVFSNLKENYDNIREYIVRFDYWLEMLIENAESIQEKFPEQVADYLTYCQETLPATARVVCFPRKPKPEDYPATWIKEHWI